uniref:Protein CLEC16A n=1 Tax=Plectus sambesii TaxID=2011161 RepID=A0A914X1A1_9BILA
MFKRFGGSGGIWKPKNPHSLEYLKYLHGLLLKNEKVTEQNRTLLVEALRSIAEILIWGDQNDSTVFDFFLEKQMLAYFLRIMKQKCGTYVCVQLLQTLNILFENIRHETSLYFLLSNNHVNSIITHRFDFSNEEIMAYYISFLKTLSFKLNSYTIHFFFNEQTNDFPLYTEAIKFFNHSEGMVRIAVRTLSLNVYRVSDQPMLDFIRNKTAAPYFSNLVWFIGNHVIDIDNFIQSTDNDTASRDRLSDLLAEHLDHIHYVNDILCLRIDSLNEVLTTQLLQRLFIPLYLGSLVPEIQRNTLHVSKVVALFLLTNVFLIITHKPLVEQLLSMLLFGDENDIQVQSLPTELTRDSLAASLEMACESSGVTVQSRSGSVSEPLPARDRAESLTTTAVDAVAEIDDGGAPPTNAYPASASFSSSSTDKSKGDRPLFASHMNTLNCEESDHTAFFGILLLYAICHNEGVPDSLLEAAQIPAISSERGSRCDRELLGRLIDLISCAGKRESRVRLITVELCCLTLRQLILATDTGTNVIQDQFLAQLLTTREVIVNELADVIDQDDMFLDIFEDEYERFERENLKIDYVSSDPALLLPPSTTPLSGVEFAKRLPCGPQEHVRKAVRVYFHLRKFLLDLEGVEETRLPLSNPKDCVTVNDCLNLNNSDLLSCTVSLKTGTKYQRFLVADGLQLILVEPDPKRVGWGIVRFVGFLQDIELTGDKDDSRALHIVVNQPGSKSKPNAQPLLTAKLVFDDHIRCMAAKQRLTKGRQKARQFKLDTIADVLEVPKKAATADSTAASSPAAFRAFKAARGKAPGYASKKELGARSSPKRSTEAQSSGSMDIPLKDFSVARRGSESTPAAPADPQSSEPDEVKVPDDPTASSSSVTSGEATARDIILPSKLRKATVQDL